MKHPNKLSVLDIQRSSTIRMENVKRLALRTEDPAHWTPENCSFAMKVHS